jgi:hypothetical protein
MSFGTTTEKVPAIPSTLKKDKSKYSRLSSQQIEMTEESTGLPVDPKVKIFGSNPQRLVKVRMDYVREPENLLA